jgi:hypothetical protein
VIRSIGIPRRRPAEAVDRGGEPAHADDHDGGRDPHDQPDEQVLEARAVVCGKTGHGQRGGVESAPVAQADEDQVAAGRRHEAREERWDEQSPHARARLHQQHARHQGARRTGPISPRTIRPSPERRSPAGQPDQRGRDHAHRGAKRDEWGLRTEHRAEREGAERRKRHARAPGKRRGLGAEPLEGRTPAVPG